MEGVVEDDDGDDDDEVADCAGECDDGETAIISNIKILWC
jgi:hypothetical protein